MEVQKFIDRFHTVSPTENLTEVFSLGCCYWFAIILYCRFPESRLMYDEVTNHFATEIDGRIYDVTGDITGKYEMAPWDDLPDPQLRRRITRDCILFEGV